MDTATIDIVTCTLTVVNHDEPWSNIINYEPLLDDAMRFTIDLYYIISYMIVPKKYSLTTIDCYMQTVNLIGATL
jgi:hypothetical protein